MSDPTTEALTTLHLAAEAISDASMLVNDIDAVDQLRNLLREARDLTERTHELRRTIGTRTLVVLTTMPDDAFASWASHDGRQDAADAAAEGIVGNGGWDIRVADNVRAWRNGGAE